MHPPLSPDKVDKECRLQSLFSLIRRTDQYETKEFREIACSTTTRGLPPITPRWCYNIV
jgi:hypothetical protein